MKQLSKDLSPKLSKAHTVQYQINKQPNEKWKKGAGDLNRDFSNDIQMPNTTWKDAQHD